MQLRNHLSKCSLISLSLQLSLMIVALGSASMSASSLRAAESEFPEDWFFSGMEAMRSSLEGGPAIELSTDTWIGDSTTLEKCQGKVVVLDFWATWCGPCVASIPKNIEMVDAFADDLVFIGIHSEKSGWDKADEMVEDRKINYPVVLDTGDTGDDYGIRAFPTYVIIDRSGIVRAAGVQPGHVKEIVTQLIEESGASGSAHQFASFDREWFYHGSERMKPWQEQVGQPASQVLANAWWTPGEESAAELESTDERMTAAEKTAAETTEDVSENIATSPAVDDSVADLVPVASGKVDLGVLVDAPDGQSDDDLINAVRVLHFARPAMAISKKQIKELNDTAAKYASQGVVFTVVCDHQSDWAATKTFALENELGVPIALDAVAESDAKANAREAGLTAQGYHVRVAPVTVVIDREGRVRATGLKLEKLNQALEMLLSERAG